MALSRVPKLRPHLQPTAAETALWISVSRSVICRQYYGPLRQHLLRVPGQFLLEGGQVARDGFPLGRRVPLPGLQSRHELPQPVLDALVCSYAPTSAITVSVRVQLSCAASRPEANWLRIWANSSERAAPCWMDTDRSSAASDCLAIRGAISCRCSTSADSRVWRCNSRVSVSPLLHRGKQIAYAGDSFLKTHRPSAARTARTGRELAPPPRAPR